MKLKILRPIILVLFCSTSCWAQSSDAHAKSLRVDQGSATDLVAPPQKKTAPVSTTQELIERSGIPQRRPTLGGLVPPQKGHSSPSLLSVISVTPAENLQTKINSASCGDIIELQAGGTWDGTFIINQNCTAANPLTIRSANHASLPSGRIGPANTISDTITESTNMARIRTVGGGSYGAAFVTGTNAGGIVFNGLEITDNAPNSTQVFALFDLGLTNIGAHDIIIDRCWMHQKETGTNYNRSVQRGVWAEGRDITVKRSYIYLIGYYYAELTGQPFYQMDTTGLLSVGGPGPLTMLDNFISVWWNGVFLGGGGSSPAHIAALSSASPTSATFSSTPPPVGTIVRFSVEGTATKSGGAVNNPGLVRLSGATLTQADGINGNNGGTAIFLTSVASPSNFGIAALSTINGDTWTTNPDAGQSSLAGIPDGTVTWELYETAKITSVTGNVATFTPVGVDELNHAPSKAAWSVGDESMINDVLLRRNTFMISPTFATHAYINTGGHYTPKGWIEIKTANRMTIDANKWLGYPAQIAIYANNQYGDAPWVKTDFINATNNLIAPDTGYPESTRAAFVYNDGGYLHTVSDMSDGSITNNFIRNLRSLAQVAGAHNVEIIHNTVINDQSTQSGYNSFVTGVGPSSNWVFRDNIGVYVVYGMLTFSGFSNTWPGGVFQNNLMIDLNGAGFGPHEWGANSILSPIPTTLAGVGFTNMAGGDFSLAPSSPYKNDASDGTDPGVNWTAFFNALSEPPTSPDTEFVWVEDAVPTGGTQAGDGEGWNWINVNPTPLSGALAQQSNNVAGQHQHYFFGASDTMTVAVGDKLFAYVYLDPSNPPSQVMLQWNNGTWEHRAYWGANQIPWGVDGTDSRRFMGPLPPSGQWVRLEVPANLVGLEGQVLNGAAFTLFDGRATWDRAGKSSLFVPTPTCTPPTGIIISEFRLRGANGASDEIVELYNTTNQPLTVCTADGTAGWAVASADGSVRFVVPYGTTIPARGHYLAVGGGYSLAGYAVHDLAYISEAPDNLGIALFNTANPANFVIANRLDAAGFTTDANSLYREGSGLSPIGTTNGQFSFVRKLDGNLPQDTSNNGADFNFVSVDGGTYGGVVAILGAPSPENLTSPIQQNGNLVFSLLDPAVAVNAAPNRVRDAAAVGPNAALGTLTLRRKITNNTANSVTRLRFRVIDITTLNMPGYTPGGSQSDVRVLTSSDGTVTLSNGTPVLVRGTTVESPPTQSSGGGLNTSMGVGAITLAQPLAPGASVNVQFVMGVQQGGSSRFFVNVEAVLQ